MACNTCCTEPPGPGITLHPSIRSTGRDKCGFEQFHPPPAGVEAGVGGLIGPPAPVDVFGGGGGVDDSDNARLTGDCEVMAGGDGGAAAPDPVLHIFKTKREFYHTSQNTTHSMTSVQTVHLVGEELSTNTTTISEKDESVLNCERLHTIDPETCLLTTSTLDGVGHRVNIYTFNNTITNDDPPDPIRWHCTTNWSANTGGFVCAFGDPTYGSEIESSETSDGDADTLIRTKTPHGYADGDTVNISGHSNSSYDGDHTASVVDESSYKIGVAFDGDGTGGISKGTDECEGAPPSTAGTCWGEAGLDGSSGSTDEWNRWSNWSRQFPGADANYHYYSTFTDVFGTYTSLCDDTWSGFYYDEYGEELLDEFTLEELIALAEAQLAAITWPAFGGEGVPIAGKTITENQYTIELVESRYKISHYRTATNYLKVWIWFRGLDSGGRPFDVFGHTYEWIGDPVPNGAAVPRIEPIEIYPLPHHNNQYCEAYVRYWSLLLSYEPTGDKPNGFPAAI